MLDEQAAPAQRSHTVYLALGSNLGDRRRQLLSALDQLRAVVAIQRISSIYETEPVGYLEQARFFNMVCNGTTTLQANDLLKYVKHIEGTMGRQATFRNGPRVIDIDILLYDDLILAQEDLIIPHPRMWQRAFVLVPLAEIAPDLRDPGSNTSLRELLTRVDQHGVRRLDHQL